MKKLLYDFHSDKFVAFGRLLNASYEADRADFIAFSPEYDGQHLSNFVSKLTLCNARINPKTIMQRRKDNTSQLHSQLQLVVPFIDQLERYMSKSNLTITAKELEFSDLRKKAQSSNAEKPLKILKDTQQLLQPHLQKLEPIGFTKDKQDQLDIFISNLEGGLTQKILIDKELQKLVNENADLLNETWLIMDDILKTGKAIYKQNDEKLNNYVKSRILKQITYEHKVASTTTSTTKAKKIKMDTTIAAAQ